MKKTVEKKSLETVLKNVDCTVLNLEEQTSIKGGFTIHLAQP